MQNTTRITQRSSASRLKFVDGSFSSTQAETVWIAFSPLFFPPHQIAFLAAEQYHKERNDVFLQLMGAEKDICAKLDVLVRSVMLPLQEVALTAPIISEEDIALSFGDARQLYILHKAILVRFEKILTKWPCVEGVGQAFLSVAQHMRIYPRFALQSEVFQTTLAALERENTTFAQFLADAVRSCPVDVAFPSTPRDHKAQGAAFVAGLLLAPLEHIGSYARLLNALAEYFEVDSDEASKLRQAAVVMNDTNKNVQAALRDSHSRAEVVAAMARFGGFQAAVAAFQDRDDRRFVFECDLVVMTSSRRKSRGRKLVLFSDKAVFASQKDKKSPLVAEEVVDLTEAVVRTCQDPKAPDARFCAEISTPTDEEGPIVIKLSSEVEKARVVHELCVAQEHSRKSMKVFGVALDVLVSQDASKTESGAPLFFERLCKFLLDNLENPDLFRAMSAVDDAQKLRKIIETTPNFAFKPTHHAPAAAACLKMFLRELPEPILTSALYPRFLAIDLCLIDDEAQFIGAITPLLKTLPSVHTAAFRVLLSFLFEVAQTSDTHGCDEHTLSLLFGSSILRKSDESEDFLALPTINALVMGMIIHAQGLLDSDAW